jgi:hypothetical protein
MGNGSTKCRLCGHVHRGLDHVFDMAVKPISNPPVKVDVTHRNPPLKLSPRRRKAIAKGMDIPPAYTLPTLREYRAV